MNDTEDGSCWNLLPSLIYELSGVRKSVHGQDESVLQHAAGCVNWTRFVRETVPCPPPTNLCLFWKAANNTNLDVQEVELVTQACNIPNRDDCRSPPLVVSGGSTDCVGLCYNSTPNAVLIGCVIGVLILLIVLCIVIAVRLYQKGKLAKWCTWCSGVCICCDMVHIQKKGLNRTESRSPTLADCGEKEEKDTCIRSSAHDNEAFSLNPKSIKLEFINQKEEEETEYEQIEMADESDGVNVTNDLDNKRLSKPNEYVDVYKPTSNTVPDVVTMVTEHVDTNERLSYC